jgi:hypothetical protein
MTVVALSMTGQTDRLAAHSQDYVSIVNMLGTNQQNLHAPMQVLEKVVQQRSWLRSTYSSPFATHDLVTTSITTLRKVATSHKACDAHLLVLLGINLVIHLSHRKHAANVSLCCKDQQQLLLQGPGRTPVPCIRILH